MQSRSHVRARQQRNKSNSHRKLASVPKDRPEKRLNQLLQPKPQQSDITKMVQKKFGARSQSTQEQQKKQNRNQSIGKEPYQKVTVQQLLNNSGFKLKQVKRGKPKPKALPKRDTHKLDLSQNSKDVSQRIQPRLNKYSSDQAYQKKDISQIMNEAKQIYQKSKAKMI